LYNLHRLWHQPSGGSMTERATYLVSSEESAARALEYFNGFHDGFMKRIVIESRDEMGEDQSQSCTGVFDVVIDFAHYNYADGGAHFYPHNQIVRGEFRNVQDIVVEFREGFIGNTIIGFSIVSVNRRAGGQTREEEALGLRYSRHFLLEDKRRYELREVQLFTFTDATFVELPARS
jgi:hypothetical protein